MSVEFAKPADEYLTRRIAMRILFTDYTERYGERDFKWKQLLMFQAQFVDICVEKYFSSFIIP